MTQLQDVLDRFSGLSIEYRKFGTNWPGRWRATLIAASNHRADYRVTCYADNMDEAINKLIAAVDCVDTGTVPEKSESAV